MDSNRRPFTPVLCYWAGVEPALMGSVGSDPTSTDFQSVAFTRLACFPSCYFSCYRTWKNLLSKNETDDLLIIQKLQTWLVLRLIHHRFTHIPPMWRQIWALRSDLMLFAAVNVNYPKITHAHAGLITRRFHGSSRKIFYPFLCLWIKNFCIYCHTATFTRFLCYTRISPVQGKLACWDFRLVRGLSHPSHQRIILPPEASIIHQPQGLCV